MSAAAWVVGMVVVSVVWAEAMRRLPPKLGVASFAVAIAFRSLRAAKARDLIGRIARKPG